MAKSTIYPYGTNGELPSSIGLVNDLTTGGVNKALTAEMGKQLNDDLFGGTESFETDISSQFSWTSKKYIVAADPEGTGVVVGNVNDSGSSSSYANVNYVDISVYSKLRVTLAYMNSPTSAPGLCFYDAQKKAVQGVWRADRSPASMTEETIDVPAGAVYVRTTWRSDYGSFYCYGIYEVQSGGLLADTEESDGVSVDITSSFVFTQSKYISQVNGEVASSSSSSSYASTLVNIRAYDKLQVYLPQFNLSQTNAGWAWYDKNQTFLSGDAVKGSSTTMVQVTLNVPQDAVYFATTKRTDGTVSTFECIGITNRRVRLGVISDWAQNELGETANVKYYGAVGDGFIDDTAAVLRAVASGARKVYFPAGTYLVGKTINIPSGMEFCGDGIGQSKIKFLGASNSVQVGEKGYETHYWRQYHIFPFIHLTAGGQNHYIHDLEIDGSDFTDASNRYIGISICTATGCKVENVYVHHVNYDSTRDADVQFEYGYQFFIWEYSSRIEIVRCMGDYAGYENIGTEDVTDVTIRDCTWLNGWRTSLQLHRGSQRVRVVNNTINNNSSTAHASLTIHGITSNPIKDIVISGNTILSTTDEDQGYRGGVAFVQSGFEDIVFIGNTFSGNSYCMVDLLGDGTSSTTYPNKVIVSDNSFTNSRYGICLLRGNNYIVKDNIIDTASTAINISATNYIVKDNLLTNNTTKAISGTEWQE